LLAREEKSSSWQESLSQEGTYYRQSHEHAAYLVGFRVNRKACSSEIRLSPHPQEPDCSLTSIIAFIFVIIMSCLSTAV